MSIAKNGGTRLTIGMTDRDVIDRVNGMFPATTIMVKHPKPLKPGGRVPKVQYVWRISRPETVREILGLLLPWFGERRAEKVYEVLGHLDSRVGSCGHNAAKTHCAQGHEYTVENTYIRKGTKYRHCRTCMAAWQRAYTERKRAA
jgi:hypothetical protein